MAKIVSKVVVIKFSKIVKDNHPNSELEINEHIAKTLEEVAQEMCDPSTVVEVEEIND